MDGKEWIEEVGEADAVRLGDQPEGRAIAIERPRSSLGDWLETGLIVTIEQCGRHVAVGVAVGQLNDIIAIPLARGDGRKPAVDKTPNDRTSHQFFETHLVSYACPVVATLKVITVTWTSHDGLMQVHQTGRAFRRIIRCTLRMQVSNVWNQTASRLLVRVRVSNQSPG